ncbi:unnamed protein product [Rhizoctonia solani]|uniref:RanBD1 domain-containing protein n=1 Tax=Rhizoctonia solani TaxID=456999 RepID=A0A8H3CHR6_9AGAM|nr:unnamed protein product [Rhizoctonia solani]
MSPPSDITAVTPNTHDDESNISHSNSGRVNSPTTTTVTERLADSQASSEKSSTDPAVANSGEDVDEPNDGVGHSSDPPSTTLVDKVTEKIRGQSMTDSAPPITETDQLQSSGHPSHSGSEGESSDKETSRKRKLSSRSSVATEAAARQHLKRPKESDVPEKEEDSEDMATVAPAPKSPKVGQVFGFGAFASNRSPFVSTQNSTSSTPAPAPEPQNRTASRTPETPQSGQLPESEVSEKSATKSPPTSKRPFSGGFAAFASASPFQSANPPPSINPASPPRESLAGPVRRSKSPVGKHQAFGQYSSGLSRFGSHAARKATQDDPGHPGDGVDKGTSGPEFDDILKAKGEFGAESDDNAARVEIQQIQYNTGEEEDFTVFQTRAKLYTQDEQFAYKERGTGLLKVNVRRSDGEGARIVMRAEGVLRLLLNMALYPGLICELGPDPKFIKVAEITPNERKFHAIKVGNAKLAQELYDHLAENTPTKSVA